LISSAWGSDVTGEVTVYGLVLLSDTLPPSLGWLVEIIVLG